MPYICSRPNDVLHLHCPMGKLRCCLKDISWGSCRNKTTAHQSPALPRAVVQPDPVTLCCKNATRAAPRWSEVKPKRAWSSQLPQTLLLPCQTQSLIASLLLAKQKQEVSSIMVSCLPATLESSSSVTIRAPAPARQLCAKHHLCSLWHPLFCMGSLLTACFQLLTIATARHSALRT